MPPIKAAPTSVALFIGPTGVGPQLTPVRVDSFAAFERQFGGLSHHASLPQSVSHFFANGGDQAYVLRVPADVARNAPGVRQSQARPSSAQPGQPDPYSQTIGMVPTGTMSGQPTTSAFLAAIEVALQAEPFFDILCLPDVMRPSITNPLATHQPDPMPIYAAAARLCAEKSAFLLIDPPPTAVDGPSAADWMSSGAMFRAADAAVYFPPVRISDPLLQGVLRDHPPSGAVAGLFARTDREQGVWRAAAGTAAVLKGVEGPALTLSNAAQQMLNPLGLNLIRAFPGHGTVAFGARTLAGADASDWKYIPVRRTSSHIRRSVSMGLRGAGTMANDPALWALLRDRCTVFMHGLFLQGAFRGASPREAYFVTCDAATTTAGDIRHGEVVIIIGFAPLKPAEFVVIKLRQSVLPGP